MFASAGTESVHNSRSDFPIVIASTPASARERQFAFGLIILLCLVFGAITPFASVPLARVDAFVPVIQTVFCFADLITAAFLLGQYRIQPQHGVLALAAGYMFAGLFAFLQTLAFPGAYAPAGLIGDPLSTAAYLFCLWHIAFPAGALTYALSKDSGEGVFHSPGSFIRTTIGVTVVGVLVVTAVLTWTVTAGTRYLPNLFADMTRQAPLTNYLTGCIWLLSLVALGLLLVRTRTSLAVWVTVAVFATLPDLALSTVMTSVRFTLGWYVARSYALIASCTVLIALLMETTVMYGRLANAVLLLRRERTNRLMSLDAATAAMAHEIGQPLTAMSLRAATALTLLERASPDVEKARASISEILAQGHRIEATIGSIRALFKQDAGNTTFVSIDEIARQALELMQQDLQERSVRVDTAFGENVPQVRADPVLLQQVILNLVANAIEAMGSIRSGARGLVLTTTLDGNSDVLLSIRDSGPGISLENRDRIFDPFFTTKSAGMGLGLSIAKRSFRISAANCGSPERIPMVLFLRCRCRSRNSLSGT